MKKLLRKGTNIIVDRYSYSGIAFSAAKPVYISQEVSMANLPGKFKFLYLVS